jgi:RNA polymerase sigma factor (sigma-70 family)
MAGEEINLRNVELDRPIDSSDEGSTTIGEVLCSVDPDVYTNYEAFEKAQTVKRLLSNLKDEDRKIVELFYGIVGDGLSVKEIAEQTGKTAAEVGRSLKVARAKMRKVAEFIER